MNRKEFNELVEDFRSNELRLKSLSKGQFIYEDELIDPFGGSYFKHKVIDVDLDEMCVNTEDLSQGGKVTKLYSFKTAEEANIL